MDINSPFTMVVLIVLISVGAGVIHDLIKSRRETAKLDGAQSADIEALKAEVSRLTERVKVLERLSTDSDARLREEIRNLA